MKVSHQYPGIKLGFSTQNFLKAMPLGVGNLKEIFEFASSEGFAFIELRDPLAELSLEDCKILAGYARKLNVDVIYEIHKDLFADDFREVFNRGVRNTAQFGEPGLMRSILSWSEFISDPDKKGWTTDELNYMATLADSCADEARQKGVQFILENIIEPWFGTGQEMGLDNFFASTSKVGLQFDTANPFLPSCRRVAHPDAVADYLPTLRGRWFTTHLKCGTEEKFQPFLRDNLLPYETVFRLMSENGVNYAALELLAVDKKEECFENHRKSVQYLADLGIVDTNN